MAPRPAAAATAAAVRAGVHGMNAFRPPPGAPCAVLSRAGYIVHRLAVVGGHISD